MNESEPNALRADLKECLRRLSEGKGEAPPGPPICCANRLCRIFIRFRVMARENPFRFEMMPSKERHLADRE